MFRKYLPLSSTKFFALYRPRALVVFRILEDRLQVEDRPFESELTIEMLGLDISAFVHKLRTVVDS